MGGQKPTTSTLHPLSSFQSVPDLMCRNSLFYAALALGGVWIRPVHRDCRRNGGERVPEPTSLDTNNFAPEKTKEPDSPETGDRWGDSSETRRIFFSLGISSSVNLRTYIRTSYVAVCLFVSWYALRFLYCSYVVVVVAVVVVIVVVVVVLLSPQHNQSVVAGQAPRTLEYVQV